LRSRTSLHAYQTLTLKIIIHACLNPNFKPNTKQKFLGRRVALTRAPNEVRVYTINSKTLKQNSGGEELRSRAHQITRVIPTATIHAMSSWRRGAGSESAAEVVLEAESLCSELLPVLRAEAREIASGGGGPQNRGPQGHT